MRKEWPLVAFTILGQTAVGLFIIGLIPSVIVAHLPSTHTKLFLMLLVAVFGLLVAAAVLSFLHLHHPLKAVRALANVRTSWLSREILFEILFMALVAAEFFLVRAGGSLGLVRLVYLLAGLAGLLFLLSMVKIYMLESLPFWNQAGTPLIFLSTSALLGALAAGGISGGLGYFFLAMILVLVDLTLAFFLAPGLGKFVQPCAPAIRPPAARSRILQGAGLGLEAAGLISTAAVSLTPLGEGLNGVVVLILFSVTVLSAQVIRRFAFYYLLGPDQVK